MSNSINLNELKLEIGQLSNKTKANNFTRIEVELFLDDFRKTLENNFLSRNGDIIAIRNYILPKNLNKLYEELTHLGYTKARGNAFHICPKNVPTNFFYSFVWGLISGCNNIVKLPTIEDDSISILLNALVYLNNTNKHNKIFENNLFVKYDKNSKITNEFSSISDVRLIWGGDETVKKLKQIPTKLTTKDLIFRNRISATIISIQEILNLDEAKLKLFFERFSRDYFEYNQKACSSPTVIFWVNEINTKYNRKNFWISYSKYIEDTKNYPVELSGLRINNLLELIFKDFEVQPYDESILKVGILKNNLFNIDKANCSYGNFIEIEINCLEDIVQYFDYDFQTLTYYGFSKKEIEKLCQRYKINIDRVVPVGYALNMNHIWDGYNIIQELVKRVYID